MHWQIIQQHDITGVKVRQKQFANVGIKDGSINGSLNTQRGDDTAQPNRTNDRQIQAAISWHSLHRSRTFARTSITSSHGEMKAGFIKEHQTLACHPSNLLTKQLARRFVSLCRHQTLFLRDRPKRCKARQTVAR